MQPPSRDGRLRKPFIQLLPRLIPPRAEDSLSFSCALPEPRLPDSAPSHGEREPEVTRNHRDTSQTGAPGRPSPPPRARPEEQVGPWGHRPRGAASSSPTSSRRSPASPRRGCLAPAGFSPGMGRKDRDFRRGAASVLPGRVRGVLDGGEIENGGQADFQTLGIWLAGEVRAPKALAAGGREERGSPVGPPPARGGPRPLCSLVPSAPLNPLLPLLLRPAAPDRTLLKAESRSPVRIRDSSSRGCPAASSSWGYVRGCVCVRHPQSRASHWRNSMCPPSWKKDLAFSEVGSPLRVTRPAPRSRPGRAGPPG